MEKLIASLAPSLPPVALFRVPSPRSILTQNLCRVQSGSRRLMTRSRMNNAAVDNVEPSLHHNFRSTAHLAPYCRSLRVWINFSKMKSTRSLLEARGLSGNLLTPPLQPAPPTSPELALLTWCTLDCLVNLDFRSPQITTHGSAETEFCLWRTPTCQQPQEIPCPRFQRCGEKLLSAWTSCAPT